MKILLVGSSLTSNQLEKHFAADSIQTEVVTCSSTEMALEIACKCPMDIVIAQQSHDHRGGQLLRQIKLNNHSTYTILIGEEIDSKGLETSQKYIDDYICLPQIDTVLRKALRAQDSLQMRAGQALGASSIALPYYPGKVKPAADNVSPLFPSEQRLSRLERHSKRRKSHKEHQVQDQRSPMPHSSSSAQELKDNESVGFSFVRLLGNIAFGFLIIVMGVVAFLMVQSKILGKPPSLAGYQMYVVVSGSMEPAIDTGSLVFAKSVDPGQVNVGDIITFQGASSNSMLTTHRVVGINNEGGLSFTTRGDANNVNDPNPVPSERIVGRVRSSVPYLGYVLGFAQTKQGLVFLIFIPGLLIILYELRNIFKFVVEEKKAAAQG